MQLEKKAPSLLELESVAEMMYRGETAKANLSQYKPESIRGEIAASFLSYKNEKEIEDKGHAYRGVVLSGAGFINNPEDLKKLMLGGEEAEKIVTALNRIVPEDARKMLGGQHDGLFRVEDLKIESPEVRDSVLKHFSDIQKTFADQDITEALAGLEKVGNPDMNVNDPNDGLLTTITKESAVARAERITKEINDAAPMNTAELAPQQRVATPTFSA